MTEQQALCYLEAQKHWGSRPGLERTHALLARIGNPERALKFVHVTGTNGKGSACAVTSAALRACGYRTGLFTSPHLVRLSERMQVDGEEIGGQELSEITGIVKAAADEMADPPTAFELFTCIGLEFFKRRRCDIVVLEVGLGGELDSTNAIPVPEAAAMTSVSLEHTQQLGNTLEEIAATKAGIMKPGCIAVLAAQAPAVMDTVREICAARGIPLWRADEAAFSGVQMTPEGMRFFAPGWGEVALPLLGRHQLSNCAVALRLLEALMEKGWDIPQDKALAGIAKTVWPGRMERLCSAPAFFVDGGHNPAGVQTAASTLAELFPNKKVTFLTGVMADKNVEAMYDVIGPLARRFLTVQPDSERALPPEQLAQLLQSRYGVESFPCQSVEEAVRRSLEAAGPEDVICALGSLYMTGRVRACFGKR